jgi:hypothetical protein
MPKRGRPESGANRDALAVQLGTCGARCKVLHHLGGRRRIEFIVDAGIQHPKG